MTNSEATEYVSKLKAKYEKDMSQLRRTSKITEKVTATYTPKSREITRPHIGTMQSR